EKRYQGDQLVVAIFYAPNTEKSQELLEKAKEVAGDFNVSLLLVDKNKYHHDLRRINADIKSSTIYYKCGSELCRTAGQVPEEDLVERVRFHSGY
ncbi:MAG: hypothetical protein Q7T50_00980, partial [Candidatus Magasanikbacteria bacterium]|nr:hypothetical protein [Candidatus Magasanikbacteria bacterium]